MSSLLLPDSLKRFRPLPLRIGAVFLSSGAISFNGGIIFGFNSAPDGGETSVGNRHRAACAQELQMYLLTSRPSLQ